MKELQFVHCLTEFKVCDAMQIAAEVFDDLWLISAGGGLPIPYHWVRFELVLLTSV